MKAFQTGKAEASMAVMALDRVVRRIGARRVGGGEESGGGGGPRRL
jgi:hypothetical protein